MGRLLREYRQRLAEGHNYKVAGNREYYDAWWSYLTQGMLVSTKLVDTAQYGYSQATDLYGQDTVPSGIDDRDALMDAGGQFTGHVTLWNNKDNELEYQAAMEILQQADQMADRLAPGVTYTSVPLGPLVTGAG